MVNTKLDIHICGPKSVFHLTHIHINHSIWSSESFLHLRHAVETDRIGTDRRKIFHGAQDRKAISHCSWVGRRAASLLDVYSVY